MPTYGYRCSQCGDFDRLQPMSEAGAAVTCVCGSSARRVFGPPALPSLDAALRRALDGSAASADAPRVVSSVPGRARRATPVTTDPRHARLPRP
jgi:putative FmdB family regulatory protein